MPVFYRNPDGSKADADIHNQILAEGDAERALNVSRGVMRTLGFSEEEITAWLASAMADAGGASEFREEMHPRGAHGMFTFGRGDRVATPHGPGSVTSAVRRATGNHHFVKHDEPVEGKVGRLYHESELTALGSERPANYQSEQEQLRSRLARTTPAEREAVRGKSTRELIRQAEQRRKARGEPPRRT